MIDSIQFNSIQFNESSDSAIHTTYSVWMQGKEKDKIKIKIKIQTIKIYHQENYKV